MTRSYTTPHMPKFFRWISPDGKRDIWVQLEWIWRGQILTPVSYHNVNKGWQIEVELYNGQRVIYKAKYAPLEVRIRGQLRYGDKMTTDHIAASQPESRDEVLNTLKRMFHNKAVDCTPYAYGQPTRWFLQQ